MDGDLCCGLGTAPMPSRHEGSDVTGKLRANVQETSLVMLEIIRAGGFSTGGFNSDAKVRCQLIDAFRSERYAGWQGELGKLVHAPATTLTDLAEHAIQSNSAPEPRSGRQESCEGLINRF